MQNAEKYVNNERRRRRVHEKKSKKMVFTVAEFQPDSKPAGTGNCTGGGCGIR